MIMQLDESKKKAQTSREVRSETRRLQSTFSEYLDMGDLFKFNQLKVGYVLLYMQLCHMRILLEDFILRFVLALHKSNNTSVH